MLERTSEKVRALSHLLRVLPLDYHGAISGQRVSPRIVRMVLRHYGGLGDWLELGP